MFLLTAASASAKEFPPLRLNPPELLKQPTREMRQLSVPNIKNLLKFLIMVQIFTSSRTFGAISIYTVQKMPESFYTVVSFSKA
jgi:hypothetical protein